MLVNYKKENILTAGLTTGSFIHIRPGVNRLTAVMWADVKHLPLVATLIEEGKLEVLGKEHDVVNEKESDAEVEGTIGSDGLGSFNAKEASALVSQTLDPELLQMWRAEEKRGGVLKAIDEQLKKISIDDEK